MDQVFYGYDQVDFTKPGCVDCQVEQVVPLWEQLDIWLHSLAYQGLGWDYEASLPYWAELDYDDSKVEARFWDCGGVWDGTRQ